MKTIIFILILFSVCNLWGQLQLNYGLVNKDATKYESFEVNLFSDKNQFRNSHSFQNIAFQVVAGSVFALAFTYPVLALSLSNAGTSDFSGGLILISAFLLGNGTGVYLISHIENSSVTFWNTVAYSFIGGGVSAGILLLHNTDRNTNISVPEGIIAAFAPLISAIVYTTFIADWPTYNEKEISINKSLTHQDIINFSKVFDLELLRYEF